MQETQTEIACFHVLRVDGPKTAQRLGRDNRQARGNKDLIRLSCLNIIPSNQLLLSDSELVPQESVSMAPAVGLLRSCRR